MQAKRQPTDLAKGTNKKESYAVLWISRPT
jgi:hypothetical protein